MKTLQTGSFFFLTLLLSTLLVVGCDQSTPQPEVKSEDISGLSHTFEGKVSIEIIPASDPDGNISEYHILVDVMEGEDETTGHVFRLQYPADPGNRIKEGVFEGRVIYIYESSSPQNTDATGFPIYATPKAVYVDVPGNRFAMTLGETKVAGDYPAILRGFGLAHFSGGVARSDIRGAKQSMDLAQTFGFSPDFATANCEGQKSCGVDGCAGKPAGCNVTCEGGYVACCGCGALGGASCYCKKVRSE
ncbi:hypothetical protein [Rhodocaloribacter sp.]